MVGENFNFILLNWVDKKRCSYKGMNESSTNIWMDLPPFKPNWDPLYSTPYIHTTNVPSLLFFHRFHHLLTLSLHPSIVSWQAGAFWQITQYFLSDLYPNPSPLPISQPPNLSLPIPEVPTYLKPSVVWKGKPNTCLVLSPPPLFAYDDDFDCPLRASSGLSGDLLTISY